MVVELILHDNYILLNHCLLSGLISKIKQLNKCGQGLPLLTETFPGANGWCGGCGGCGGGEGEGPRPSGVKFIQVLLHLLGSL